MSEQCTPPEVATRCICPWCAYDVSGLAFDYPSMTCPECGSRVFRDEGMRGRALNRWTRLDTVLALVGSAVVCASVALCFLSIIAGMLQNLFSTSNPPPNPMFTVVGVSFPIGALLAMGVIGTVAYSRYFRRFGSSAPRWRAALRAIRTGAVQLVGGAVITVVVLVAVWLVFR